jgi:hypothetical protein
MSLVAQNKEGGDVLQGQKQVIGQNQDPDAFAPIGTGLNIGDKYDTAAALSGYNLQAGANVGIQAGAGGDAGDIQAINSGNIGPMVG